MSCVDSITGSVSLVPETKSEELWDKYISTQTAENFKISETL